MKITNIIKRYYQNVSLIGAYSRTDFIKEVFKFPFDYYLRGGKSSFPINITLALTLRCNAKCSMCALQDLIGKDNSELSTQQYIDFIRSVVAMKPGFVLYGGEPFLRKDILSIIKEIKSFGLSCGVFTNGLLLNEALIREIAQLEMNFIIFSIYGPKQIHDRIVGINGAYDKVIKNISLLKKYRRKTKIIIHCTISEQNVKYLKEVSGIPIVDGVRFGHLTFFTEREKQAAEINLKQTFPKEKIALSSYAFNTDLVKAEEFRDNLIRLKRSKKKICFTPELEDKEIVDWYGHNFKSLRKCLFIWRGVFITPNGDVYPCMGNFYYKMGNILREDFTKIWNNDKFINFRLTLKKGLLSACSRCCRL